MYFICGAGPRPARDSQSRTRSCRRRAERPPQATGLPHRMQPYATSLPAKMPIGKREVLIPIVRGDVMLAGANVVSNGLAHRLVNLWHPIRFDALLPQQPVDRSGVDC